jgi:hypothetical protein
MIKQTRSETTHRSELALTTCVPPSIDGLGLDVNRNGLAWNRLQSMRVHACGAQGSFSIKLPTGTAKMEILANVAYRL